MLNFLPSLLLKVEGDTALSLPVAGRRLFISLGFYPVGPPLALAVTDPL